MFRRRQGRPQFRGGPPDVPPILQRANRLLESGQYAEAAVAFEELAAGALARRGPRAPIFFLQAGRARVLNGQADAGLAHLKHGLQLFAEHGAFQRVYKAGNRTVTELKAHGFVKEAQEIEAFINTLLPAGMAMPAQGSAEKKHAVLPTHCPSCGAGVRPDEVEWLDDVTAECEYCGSPVRGTI